MKTKGNIIALYGINNLGKSTQVERLKKHLEDVCQKAIVTIKFPVYDLEPTGPKLNDYLRNGNPRKLTPRLAQILYAQNRHDFVPRLRILQGMYPFLVLEDYTGTGIAWGHSAGVPLKDLFEMNEGLPQEDLAILLDGERFTQGIEKNHKHENDHSLIDTCRATHLSLAKELGWRVVNANQSVEDVEKELWNIVSGHFDL